MTSPLGSVADPAGLIAEWPVGSAVGMWTGTGIGEAPSVGACASYGDTEKVYQLASVTKPLFAYAILIAIEEGTLGLDEPSGPAGATLRHLLAHASGLGFNHGDPVIPPQQRRVYSNAGFDVLGDLLAQASGMKAAEYFYEAVCVPLGMGRTRLEGSPAFAATSTAADLMRFLDELAAPSLISAETHALAFTPAWPELDGVLPGYGMQRPNPWGLGFEVRGLKNPHWTGSGASPSTVGHFGAAGTFIWFDPLSGQRAVVLTDTDFGAWATTRWPHFNQRLLAVSEIP